MHATPPASILEPDRQLALREEAPLAVAEKPTGSNRWSIALNVVKDTIARLDLGQDHAEALLFVQDYGWHSGKSLAEVGAELRRSGNKSYDKNTLYKILHGKHEASLDTFTAAVAELRERVESRRAVAFPFVQTARCEEIWEFCEMAGTYQDIVTVIGPSHSGKSEGFKSFVRRKRFGRVKRIELRPGGYVAETKTLLCRELGISGRYNTADQLQLIVEAVDPGMTLIFDEVHRVFTSGRAPRIQTIDLIRYIHDTCECGVVLGMNEEGRAHIEEGSQNSRRAEIGGTDDEAVFASLLNREFASLRLDRLHSSEDLALFAQAIGLPAATGPALDLQATINGTKSLGKWVKLLRAAMKIASKRKETLTWNHVINADKFVAAKQRGNR